MKRVLLLTYHVPPRAAIASVRMGQIISLLPRYGWEIVPVTPDLGDVEYGDSVHTTALTDFKAPFRRLLGVKNGETTQARLGLQRSQADALRPAAPAKDAGLKRRVFWYGYVASQFANTRFGWLRPGATTTRQVLSQQRFDVILSSSPPSATHLVAARVHGSIPWVADLRDPWYRNDEAAFPEPFSSIDRMMEPRVLHSASALTVISEPLAEELRGRHVGKPIYSIPNAFSAAEWDAIPFEEPQQATFVHAGQLYEGARDPRPFFAALKTLLEAGAISRSEVGVDFYGPSSDWLRLEIDRFALHDVVHLRGMIEREQILRIERSATRLLMFLWDGPHERGTFTGKLFEYLGARRKIIAVGGPPEMVIDDALERTGAGKRYRNESMLQAAILEAVQEWRSGRSAIVDSDAVAPFESNHLARRFAQVFDDVTATRIVATS